MWNRYPVTLIRSRDYLMAKSEMPACFIDDGGIYKKVAKESIVSHKRNSRKTVMSYTYAWRGTHKGKKLVYSKCTKTRTLENKQLSTGCIIASE